MTLEIILFRHGRVNFDNQRWISGHQLDAEVSAYNSSPLDVKTIDREHGISPGLVVTSSLSRSLESAHLLFGRADLSEHLFREAELPNLPWLPVRLPVFAHFFLARISWILGNKADCESYREFRERVAMASKRLVDLSSDHKNIVLVGHGFINQFLAIELLKMGFSGSRKPNRNHWQGTSYNMPSNTN